MKRRFLCALIALVLAVGCAPAFAVDSGTFGEFLLYEGPAVTLRFTGKYTFDRGDTALVDDSFDFFPALTMEIVLENHTNLDLMLSPSGGTINGWTADPSFLSLENDSLPAGSKSKTYLTLLNVEYQYEIAEPEMLDTLQLSFIVYEDRQNRYVTTSYNFTTDEVSVPKQAAEEEPAA